MVLLPQNWFTTRSERAQSMVEYALVVAVVSMVAIVTMKNVGTNLKSVFTKVSTKLHS
jgi:Flp pilus assembly pilin Flp